MAEETLLTPKGLFNPTLRFAFTNVTSEDFTSYWGGSPIIIKAGQSVELAHHLAVKLTRELVDKIMIGEAKLDEDTYYKNNPNTAPNMYRSPKGISLGIPQARKVWEDKICRLMTENEEDPQMQVKKAEWKAQIMSEMNQEPSREPVPVPVANLSAGQAMPAAFADLDKKEQKGDKPAIKVKEVQ